jgi:hypothetical protein
MKNNTGQICVEFNRKAVKLFQFLYKQYEKAIHVITREKDEQLLIDLNNQYVNTLKLQLDQMALSLLDKYKVAVDNIVSMQHILTEQVNFYLNEFNHKSGLLYFSVLHTGNSNRDPDNY